MASTPTSSSGSSSFPFAVNCKLNKTFFSVPRKCSRCKKILLFTGYACQFCSYCCHKKCAIELPQFGLNSPIGRPQLCSLSKLPADEELFSHILRENEINSNDMDTFLDECTGLVSSLPLSRSTSEVCAVNGLPIEDPSATVLQQFWALLMRSSRQQPTTVLQKRCRHPHSARQSSSHSESQTSKKHSLSLALPSSSVCSGLTTPIRTPVDEFNDQLLEEVLMAGSGRISESDIIRRRLNWVRYIVGDRGAQSQDLILREDDNELKFASTRRWVFDGGAQSPELARSNRCATWPLSGMHVNYGDREDDLVAENDGLDYESYIAERNHCIDLGEWNVPFKDIEFGTQIHQSRQMDAFKGKWHGDVTVHVYAAGSAYNAMQEVRMLAKIRHENVALFMGLSVDGPDGKLLVITSIRTGESLYRAIHIRGRKFSHHSKMHIVRQMIQGLAYLHARGVLLKSLSSQNVFLEGKVKISMVDYGTPQKVDDRIDRASLLKGHITYLSPELIRTIQIRPPALVLCTPFTMECDVYAFGTILYEMIEGKYPLADFPIESQIWLLGSYYEPELNKNPEAPLGQFLNWCWASDPNKRHSFRHILHYLQQTAALQRKHCSSEPKLHRVGRSFSDL